MFLDQPTQVYFPSLSRDTSETCSKETQEKSNKAFNKDFYYQCVVDMFTQLANYCKKLEENYDFSPQFIVTDHVDNLDLKDTFNFDDFVGKIDGGPEV